MGILKRALRVIRRKTGFRALNGRLAGTKCFKKKAKILRKMGFSIGENTKVVGPFTSTSSSLKIGNECWIGRGFEINGNGKVTIGNCCDIAPNVHIHTGGHLIGNKKRRAGDGICNDITIGDGCWICAEAVIVNSVNVGQGSIVLPGAVVTNDVPPNTMVGGIPAKIIKTISPELEIKTKKE